MTKIEKVIELMQAKLDEDCYLCFGLRQQEKDVSVGEQLDNSYVWDDGEWTDEELDGTCSVGIDYADEESVTRAINRLGKVAQKRFGLEVTSVNSYPGDKIILIYGDSAISGNDPDESVIRNAKVLGIF